MPDLGQQLRTTVDRVPPVSINDAATTHQRRRRRRAVSTGFTAIVALLIAGTAGLVTQEHPHPTVVSVEPAASGPPAATSPPAVGAVIPGSEIANVDFVNPKVGYGSGRGTPVEGMARTTDGGVTWRVVTPAGGLPAGPAVDQVVFASPEVGYAIGAAPGDSPGASVLRGRLERTADGGRTWSLVPGVEDVDAIAVSATHAYALTLGGNGHASLWRSGDGGATWQGSPTPIPVPRWQTLLLSPFQDSEVQVTADDGAGPVQLFTTTDAGRSWTTRATPCPDSDGPASPVTAATADSLWLVCVGRPGTGDQGKEVYRTSDGGRTWTLTAAVQAGQPPTVGRIPAVGYVDQLTAFSDTSAYLGASRGAVEESTDGGRTWHAVLPPAANGSTYNLFGPTSGAALVDGVAWRTTDGSTWTRTP